MSNVLDKFERDLYRKGFGVAPNDASYKMILWGSLDIPAVERVYEGDRNIIVGFKGEQFSSREDAIYWAVQDGRHVIDHGKDLNERRFIE